MKFQQLLLPVFGLLAAVQAWPKNTNGTVVWTTVTVDIYTTYCPEATTFTYSNQTITVTAATTVTICSTYTVPVTTYWSNTTTTTPPPVIPPPSSTVTVPAPTTSGPLQVTANAGFKNDAGLAAVVLAGVVAMML